MIKVSDKALKAIAEAVKEPAQAVRILVKGYG